jgi:hypothetical protein
VASKGSTNAILDWRLCDVIYNVVIRSLSVELLAKFCSFYGTEWSVLVALSMCESLENK